MVLRTMEFYAIIKLKREVIMNFFRDLFEKNNIDSVSATMIDELIEKGAYILDVREPYEIFERGIEGTHNIRLDDLNRDYENIPKEKIYVLCRSGKRSLIAAKFLKSKGYEAINISGGIEEYFYNK